VAAICGRIERKPSDALKRDCGALLSRLAAFSGQSARISAVPGGAFGASLRATLPEDDDDRQPLLEEDRWLFAADVRLDNREELQRALGVRNRRVADSEILFRALISWGEGALDRVIGDFAFALFDARAKRLLLARDPTGQRPLYYAMGKAFVAFASMPSGLAGGRGIGGELNYEALARAISDVPVAGDSSYFSGVRKVRPGHLVTIEEGNARSRDYWHPPHNRSDWVDRPDYVEAYRSVLDEAVKPRLRRRTAAVASQLSSGLDSGAVTSAAARLAGSANVIGLTSAPADTSNTVNPRGRFPDESELAGGIAEFLGIRHVVVRERGSAIAHLRAQAGLYQEPYRNNINAGWITQLAFAARTEGCDVMLTGDVGNLTLNGGSLANLGDLVRSGDWGPWMREARLAMRCGGARWTGVLMNSFGQCLPHWAVDFLQYRVRGMAPRTSETFVRRDAVDRFVRPALPLRHETRASGSYADRLALLRSYDFGNHNKGALAETGVDSRHPLLDRRAIEFSLVTPPEQLFRDGRSRSLARRALSGWLPESILAMSDRGYQAADWHKRVSRAELLAMVEEIESSSAAEELIDTKKLRTTAERWDRIDFNDPAQDLAITTYLSLALAGGLFVLEAERGFPSLSQTLPAITDAT
jgi:asparagine synthase (glutamine-hydrolysing)